MPMLALRCSEHCPDTQPRSPTGHPGSPSGLLCFRKWISRWFFVRAIVKQRQGWGQGWGQGWDQGWVIATDPMNSGWLIA